MTKREFLTALMEGTATSEQIIEYCTHEIELLDKKALKSRERTNKKRAEGDELRNRIYGLLDDQPQIIPDLLAQLEDDTLTSNKVANRLSQLYNMGLIDKEVVMVEGPDGKHRKMNAYWLSTDFTI